MNALTANDPGAQGILAWLDGDAATMIAAAPRHAATN